MKPTQFSDSRFWPKWLLLSSVIQLPFMWEVIDTYLTNAKVRFRLWAGTLSPISQSQTALEKAHFIY